MENVKFITRLSFPQCLLSCSGDVNFKDVKELGKRTIRLEKREVPRVTFNTPKMYTQKNLLICPMSSIEIAVINLVELKMSDELLPAILANHILGSILTE